MSDAAAVQAAAEAYCKGLHVSDPVPFETLCHDAFLMSFVDGAGAVQLFDKEAFMARVAGRGPFPGAPSFGIETVDLAGPTIAHVRLWVDVPPRRFTDYLGYVRVEGQWRLITKLTSVLDGPDL